MNEVYAAHVGEARPRARRRGLEAPVRRARRDRGGRAALVPMGAVDSVALRHSLGRPYSSRRAARDPHGVDFVVPGVGTTAARRARAARPRRGPHRRRPARRRAGLLPRTKQARQPSGRISSRARVERSTGPGRHDFEIVADAGISLGAGHGAPRLHDQRDRAGGSRGEVVDPLGGRDDLDRRLLRTGPASFRDDPLRIVRGLRFVSQLDVDRRGHAASDARVTAARPRLGRADRRRAAADGLGALEALLLGPTGEALRLARDTGVLVHVLPEFEPCDRLRPASAPETLTLDEHVFAVVQAAADGGAPLEVRSRALLHDLGKPEAERGGRRMPRSARSRPGGAHRGSATRPGCARTSSVGAGAPVRASADDPQPVDARRFLARHGERSRSTCSPTATPISGKPSEPAGSGSPASGR